MPLEVFRRDVSYGEAKELGHLFRYRKPGVIGLQRYLPPDVARVGWELRSRSMVTFNAPRCVARRTNPRHDGTVESCDDREGWAVALATWEKKSKEQRTFFVCDSAHTAHLQIR